MTSPTWTILIPTLGQRGAQLRELLDRLLPQTEPYAGRVRVLAAFNNGTPALPEIRQRLVEAVTTDYLSFVDDDDMVAGDFVSSVMGALETNPDYVGFQVNYLAEGNLRGVIDHSLKHGGWHEQRNPYRWVRDITHLNPMRTEVAQAVTFRGVGAGQVEDRPWVAQIRESGRLVIEVYVPRPLYDYRWSRRGSAWQRPDRIRTGPRLEVSHPHFSWLELESPADLGRLAVIVPTRGRPDNVRRLLAAWDETQAWDCADLILAVDGDDPEIEGYREIHAEQPERLSLWIQDAWTPMVPKLNQCARDLEVIGNYSAIAFAGDDHLPRTPGWAEMYLAALRELGTGMVYGDDGYQGKRLSTEWAVTADAVRALGRMVPAPVDHLYCDNAMMDLFGGAGALRHLPEVRIEHMHPAAGKASRDEQYDRVNSREQYAGDRVQYEGWKGSVLHATQIEIIRRLRGDRPEEKRRPAARAQRVRSGTMRMSSPRRLERSRPSRLNAPPKSAFPFPASFREVRGATPDEIAFTLADYAKNVPADQEIVELGVFQGRTAIIMAWGAAQGHGAHVTAIDPWDLPGNVYDPPFTERQSRLNAESNVARVGYGDRIELLHGFSVDFAEHWRRSDAKQVGLLFVDGDHTKEGARRDIEAWAPHLATGAVIAVDDYGHPDWPGVAQAVDELVDEGFLEPVQVLHDRLAVTRLTEMTPEQEQEFQQAEVLLNEVLPPVTSITSEGVSRETRIDSGVAPTLGEARKRARLLGLKPVAGGIEAVLAQIAEHEARQ